MTAVARCRSYWVPTAFPFAVQSIVALLWKTVTLGVPGTSAKDATGAMDTAGPELTALKARIPMMREAVLGDRASMYSVAPSPNTAATPALRLAGVPDAVRSW